MLNNGKTLNIDTKETAFQLTQFCDIPDFVVWHAKFPTKLGAILTVSFNISPQLATEGNQLSKTVTTWWNTA